MKYSISRESGADLLYKMTFTAEGMNEATAIAFEQAIMAVFIPKEEEEPKEVKGSAIGFHQDEE